MIKEHQKAKPWVEIIKGNRLPFNGTEINYIAPMIVNREVKNHIRTRY